MKKSAVNRVRLEQPATYGGKGWQSRHNSLRDEIDSGNIWHPCGYQSESSTLKEVVLSRPGEELQYNCSPDKMLMLQRPNLPTIQKQVENLARFYESQGVKVHLANPTLLPPPNFLFQRDLFWATPEGIVLARPAAIQRAGEERFAAEVLSGIGVPIIMHFRGTATFEGADALWLDSKTVLLGTGVRTNAEAARQLRAFLDEIEVELIETPLPENSQHLLGIVNFVACDLAVVHGGKVTKHITNQLAAKDISTIVLPEDDELNISLGMNFVTLGSRKIIMPSGSPGICAKMKNHDIEVHEINVSEYLKAAGGLACLTGILRRQS